jgi:hypothetical protein
LVTRGIPGGASGHDLTVENMPSPARAERNQRRKLAFIPIWPIVGAIIVVVVLVILTH